MALKKIKSYKISCPQCASAVAASGFAGVNHWVPGYGIFSIQTLPLKQQEILIFEAWAVVILCNHHSSVPRWLPLLLSLFFPWAFAPPLLISFLSALSSSFPPCSFLLVLSPFLQIRGLMITRGGSYQVLTVYQALGSALASHHLIWASLPPCEVGTVIIIPTLQTSNWSQGRLGNLPKDTQLCIGDPIPTDITSAVLFPLFHIGAKRREWRD